MNKKFVLSIKKRSQHFRFWFFSFSTIQRIEQKSIFRETCYQAPLNPTSFFSARVTPFTLDVFTDGFEADADAAADAAMAKAAKNEASAGVAGEPTGTMGFSLGFTQVAC